jgi:hypothetical protein
MNYKTTLIIAAIAATAFAALGSAYPMVGTAFASNGGGGGGNGDNGVPPGNSYQAGDACNSFGDIENCAGNNNQQGQGDNNFQVGEFGGNS